MNTILERLILALFRGYSCVKILLGKGTTLCKNICSKWFINSKIGPNISSFNESMPFTMWSRCFSLPHFLPLESVSALDLLWQVKWIKEVCILLPNVDLKRVRAVFLYSLWIFFLSKHTWARFGENERCEGETSHPSYLIGECYNYEATRHPEKKKKHSYNQQVYFVHPEQPRNT